MHIFISNHRISVVAIISDTNYIINIKYNVLLSYWDTFLRILKAHSNFSVHSPGFKDCLYSNEYPELPLDGLWLVPGVSAACLSTPDTLSVSPCVDTPFQPRVYSCCQHIGVDRTPAQKNVTGSWNRSWLTPSFEPARTHSRIRKHSCCSYMTCDQRWRVHGLSFES